MADKVFPQTADVVRVISNIGGISHLAYAFVLHRSITEEDRLGENREPALSLVFLNGTTAERTLSGPDFMRAFHRESAVPHVSSPAVKEKRCSVYWIDMLPAAGEVVDLEEVEQKHAAAPAVPAFGLIADFDTRTGLYIKTDGMGAFVLVRADNTVVETEAGARPLRFSTVEEAWDHIERLPTSLIPADSTSELPGQVEAHSQPAPEPVEEQEVEHEHEDKEEAPGEPSEPEPEEKEVAQPEQHTAE